MRATVDHLSEVPPTRRAAARAVAFAHLAGCSGQVCETGAPLVAGPDWFAADVTWLAQSVAEPARCTVGVAIVEEIEEDGLPPDREWISH